MNIQIIEEFLKNQPVDSVEIRDSVKKLLTEYLNIKRAILTGSENKYRYSGVIPNLTHQEAVCACGETVIFRNEGKLSWDTIRSVLTLVQDTAKNQQ